MDDYTISSARKKSMQAYVEAVISNYDESIAPENDNTPLFTKEHNAVMESMIARDNLASRYHSFSNTIRNSLVTEALCHMFKRCVPEKLLESNTNRNIMRSIVCDYVNEAGYTEIMNRMKAASNSMSMLYNVIDESTKAILEGIDQKNPETFKITPEMRDEFFRQLDYSDSQAITDAINDRVSDAIQDFVTANTKDHEDIAAALKHAQEQIADAPPEDVDLKESYQIGAKRKVNQIRNAPKGVFHAMVSSLCEGIMKNKDDNAEFFTEGHLDMPKIVDRTRLMYTFMEMLNTTRLADVNGTMLESIIEGLKK